MGFVNRGIWTYCYLPEKNKNCIWCSNGHNKKTLGNHGFCSCVLRFKYSTNIHTKAFQWSHYQNPDEYCEKNISHMFGIFWYFICTQILLSMHVFEDNVLHGYCTHTSEAGVRRKKNSSTSVETDSKYVNRKHHGTQLFQCRYLCTELAEMSSVCGRLCFFPCWCLHVKLCLFECSNWWFAFITSDILRQTAFSVTMETGN